MDLLMTTRFHLNISRLTSRRIKLLPMAVFFIVSMHCLAGETAYRKNLESVKGADMIIYDLYEETCESDPLKAVKYGEIFLEKLDSETPVEAIADIHSYLAKYYEKEKYAYSTALAHSLASGRIYKKLRLHKKLSGEYLRTARLYTRKLDIDSAYEKAYEALQIIDASDTEAMIEYNKLMGMIFYMASELELSERYFQQSVNLAKKSHDNDESIEGLGNMGTFSFRTDEEKRKGLVLMEEAARKARNNGDSITLATLYLNMAGINVSLGNYDETRKWVNRADSIEGTLLQRGHRAQIMAQMYMNLDSIPQAITWLENGVQTYSEGEFPGSLINMYGTLAHLYDAIGDTNHAYKYLRMHKALSDSIKKEDSLKRLFHLYNRNSIAEEAAANKAEAKRALLLWGGVLLVILIILVTAAYLILRRKAKRQIEAKVDKRIKILTNIEQISSLRKDTILKDVITQLNSMILKNRASKLVPQLKEIVKLLDESADERTVEEIGSYAPGLESDLYNALMKDYPNLTPNESRICVFVSMNMSTKQIADITRQSTDAIKMARTRLRNKFGLTGEKTSLQEFLNKYR